MYFKFTAKEIAISTLLLGSYLSSVRASKYDSASTFENEIKNQRLTASDTEADIKKSYETSLNLAFNAHEELCKKAVENKENILKEFKKSVEDNGGFKATIKNIKEAVSKLRTAYNGSPVSQPSNLAKLSRNDSDKAQKDIADGCKDLLNRFSSEIFVVLENPEQFSNDVEKTCKKVNDDVGAPLDEAYKRVTAEVSAQNKKDSELIARCIERLRSEKSNMPKDFKDASKCKSFCDRCISELESLKGNLKKNMDAKLATAEKTHKEKMEVVNMEKLSKELSSAIKKIFTDKKECLDVAKKFITMITIYASSQGSLLIYAKPSESSVQPFLDNNARRVKEYQDEVAAMGNNAYLFGSRSAKAAASSKDDNAEPSSTKDKAEKSTSFFKSWTFYLIMGVVAAVVIGLVVYLAVSSSSK